MTTETPPQSRALLLLAATSVFSGALIGASTNAVNGAVSPTYFRNTLRWHDVEEVWRASIAQGIFEGSLYGVAFAVVLTLVIGIVSRARCPYGLAFRHLLAIVAAVYACWVVGGLTGVGLAALSPEFFRNSFAGVPEDYASMLRYAWVGGSILGTTAGGVLAVVLGSVLFPNRWRRWQAANAT